ncbi:MAG TPA: PEP-CTERM sorting domain-containing protein, partial [Luteolibacter sp.]
PPMKRFLVAFGVLSFVSSNSFAAISVSSDTDTGGWIAIGGNYDYLDDQQTGQPQSDIVGGTGYNAGFFTNWDAGGASHTDGTLGFRVRLDRADTNQNTFSGLLWVGVDANSDGALDIFFGANNKGNNTNIEIRDAGSGLNNSPNTTTIDNSVAGYIFAETSSNYNYRPVNFTTDGGTTNDMTTGGTDTDYYLSFTVDFAKVVQFLGTQGIAITDESSLRYVLGTATQDNSLNQDLGNINNKTANLSQTWEQLGGFSPAMNATGTVVPEPSAALLGGLGFIGLLRRRRY